MKNILIIHQSLGGGGAERVLVDILNKFDYEKYRVELLIVFNHGCYINQINSNVVLNTIYSQGKRSFLKKFLTKIKLSIFFEKKEIHRIITKHYDTIISFMEGLPLKYHSLITHYSTRNITWIHSDFLVNNWREFYFSGKRDEKKCYEKMDKIIFVSDKSKQSFEQVFNISVQKQIIYNIIDSERIKKAERKFIPKKNKFTLCNVGRLCIEKNQQRLIEAAKMLKDSGCVFDLWIVGMGPLEKELKKIVKENCLENEIQFLGFQSNPYPYISNADIFVLSSDTEGYPTVICEALLLGRPIVSTDVTGCRELLGNSEYGIITDTSTMSFYNAILELYKSDKKRIHLQNKAINRSLIFSERKTMESIYNLINE